MDRVLIPQLSSGGGSAMSIHFGLKIMWASYLCLMAVSFQFLKQTADAAPVLASSVGYCQNVLIKADPKVLDCCLPDPDSTQAKRFVPPGSSSLRERKPAHVLARDPVYVAKYNLAYEKMRALPKGDPMSFDTQWKTHCAFCNEAFLQKLTSESDSEEVDIPLQVHYSWLFLPWHRMLIYFHEKILGKLIDDPNFTLPFWNWDNQLDEGANQIPCFFLPGFSINTSALINQNRNPDHFPPHIIELGYNSKIVRNMTKEEIIDENLAIIHNNVMSKIASRDFLGGPYAVGSDLSTTTIPIEMEMAIPGESGGCEILHNTAHEWVGLVNNTLHPDNEDMGTFIYAGKDPIFYTHHANVDRLWNVWKTLPDTVTESKTRPREDFTDRDFLDTEFTFYDENRDMVIVKVRDILDTTELGYTYTPMAESDRLWIEHPPKPAASTTKRNTWKPTDFPIADATTNNTIYGNPTTFRVARRAPNVTDLIGKPIKHVNQLTEEVMMEEVKIPHNRYVRLDAFINLPSADNTTDVGLSDFVGTFTHLPSGRVVFYDDDGEKEEELFRSVDIHYSITTKIARLNITDYNTPIVITIVPRMRLKKTIPITFKSLRQDFQ